MSAHTLLLKTGLAPALLAWYVRHKRALPWRNSADPYRIWLSEIILQQTRVVQGQPYWERYVEKYPTVQQMAAAPDDEVMRLWQGLGYYSRARNMLKAARKVATEGWPETYEGLLALPGVGPYTAAAVGSFAFNLPTAVLDGNVMRVLTRLAGIDDDIALPATQAMLRTLANELIDKAQPAEFNQAIMEFGALQCVPVNPRCLLCPLRDMCLAQQQGRQNEIPYKAPAKPKRQRWLHYLLLYKEDKLALRRRTGPGIWQGLYEPVLIETDEPGTVPDFGMPIQPVSQSKHILSHQLLHLHFYRGVATQAVKLPDEYRFYLPEEVEALPKPRPMVGLV